MLRLTVLASAMLPLLVFARPSVAEPTPQHVLSTLPVKEITVFKDGHAFLLHEGALSTDDAGNVVIDTLPAPVLGTFWPYSADKRATLHAVMAGRRTVRLERTALSLRELVEANPGAEVVVRDAGNEYYPATIVGFLERSTAELTATSLPGSGEQLPQKSNLLLLKTAEGTKVVPFERISDVKFIGPYRTRLSQDEHRNRLTIELDWNGKQPAPRATVGMAYLQKGIRWIPNYRVEIDGQGKAVLTLQATVLNELVDLKDVTLNLVVGVPTFQFKDSVDPIALSQNLQQATAQLSQYFEMNSRTAYGFGNAMMTQVARSGEHYGRQNEPPPQAELGPDIAGDGKNEDLFVYTVRKVSLKKGQRAVLPVSRVKLDYQDLYTLELPFAPPPEYRRTINPSQADELARLLNAPKVMHKIRLKNSAAQPLTTAPALVVKEGRVLAQGMMTYTASGASTDLALTSAIDVKVKKTDKEIRRTPNAARWQGEVLQRIDLAGSIRLSNFRGQATEIEIVRHVLGNVDSAGSDGRTEMVNLLEDDSYTQVSTQFPYWQWYAWPGWWRFHNGIGRITWTVKLEPGKSADLPYEWHYYSR